MIYLDHNATTPLDPEVLEAMLPYMQGLYGNPSSLYRLGRIASSALHTAREQVAALINALPEQIIFTSGGTEANTLAIANAGHGKKYYSAIEHPSVAINMQAHAHGASQLPVNTDGQFAIATLEAHALAKGDFISLMLANNETGVIQPVSQMSLQLQAKQLIVHCDAIQALGKINVDFKELAVDMMSLSSHKIYGPKGCGALVVKDPTKVKPLLYGGSQENSLRAGTENVAAIVGFGKAAERARLALSARYDHLLNLRNQLEQQLSNISGLVIFAQNAPRLPNTVQFGVAGMQGEMLLMQLDRQGIAVSSGSACNAGASHASPVLLAMNVDADLAGSAIRISLGKDNTEQQLDKFVSTLKDCLRLSY